MDAIVLNGLGFAPSVENDQSDGFSFWELGVVLEFPVNVAGATHSWIQITDLRREREAYQRRNRGSSYGDWRRRRGDVVRNARVI